MKARGHDVFSNETIRNYALNCFHCIKKKEGVAEFLKTDFEVHVSGYQMKY